MFQARRLSAAALATAAVAAALAGCASKPGDRIENWSPKRIHSEAREEAGAGSYDKAIPLFEALEGRAAGTPLAQQAQLEKAYAQFRNGDKASIICFFKVSFSSSILYCRYVWAQVLCYAPLGLCLLVCLCRAWAWFLCATLHMI